MSNDEVPQVPEFLIWEWMLPEKHRVGFRRAILADRENTKKIAIEDCSAYWRSQIALLSDSGSASAQSVITALCDCLHVILEVEAICIHNIDDSDSMLRDKMIEVEQRMLAVIHNQYANERAKNIARRILSLVYQQSLGSV